MQHVKVWSTHSVGLLNIANTFTTFELPTSTGLKKLIEPNIYVYITLSECLTIILDAKIGSDS